jgi:bifunctional NMN adenylyltransferase/nudix hydrolase
MQVKETFDVGVIVGRFQVPELHDAHRQLIEQVIARHDKVVVFLGLSPLMVTQENPLDFEARKQMLLAEYPKLNVLYIKDVVSDKAWSERLDEMIEDVLTPSQSVVLYGGRDSFVKHYTGIHPSRELTQDVWISGSEIRKSISRRSVKSSPDFRAGVVWASQSRFPTSYTTVDVAIFDDERHQRVLLGRKSLEDRFRFIGGFSTPNAESFEQDAIREAKEETGLDVHRLEYVGSYKINDWRYRSESDKIKTVFFKAYTVGGVPHPNDDICEVRWFDVEVLTEESIVPSHHILWNALVNLKLN